MMRNVFIVFISMLCTLPCVAQTNKSIRQLERERNRLEKAISQNQEDLTKTNKSISSQIKNLEVISGRIKKQKNLIRKIDRDIKYIGNNISLLSDTLTLLSGELDRKRAEFAKSLRYIYKNRGVKEKLMFILSADDLMQVYRRMRYVASYARYQKEMGEKIEEKKQYIDFKKNEQSRLYAEKKLLFSQNIKEKAKLENMEKEQNSLVIQLKGRQKELKRELAKRRKEAARLNNKIEELIAKELERARREEERRRKELERKREKEAKNNGSKNISPEKDNSLLKEQEEDVKLSSNFDANKGKLPIPISGRYAVVSHFGQYRVNGLKNVTLDNKGIDIEGMNGARAQSIYNGRVAAIFKLNGLFNVLVRHGKYISVYCNLKDVCVSQGEKVKTKQPLGTVSEDVQREGKTILHFQLRRETKKMDPEIWLKK